MTNLIFYSLLYITVISLWIPRKSRIQYWHVLVIASILYGLLSGKIELIALVPIVLLPAALIYMAKTSLNSAIRFALFILALLLGAGLGSHLLPGFHNLKVLNQVYLSNDAAPFTMYLNFDKTLVGIFILGLSVPLITHSNSWIKLFKQTIPFMIGLIFVVILFAFAFDFVRFDPKLPDCLPIWIITNLLFVCTAEEAFFRGFLQKNLSLMMSKIPYGNYLAILCASLLFGISHYMGGIQYVLLATIAGVGYGFIYDKTKQIESSIITHFCLNLTHILLFTYPMLGKLG